MLMRITPANQSICVSADQPLQCERLERTRRRTPGHEPRKDSHEVLSFEDTARPALIAPRSERCNGLTEPLRVRRLQCGERSMDRGETGYADPMRDTTPITDDDIPF